MSEKITYKSRLVGGAAVMRMPMHTLGKHFTQTEGKNGVIYLTPVSQKKENESMINSDKILE